MLNQETPASNILLCREVKRGKSFETAVVRTEGESWMAPFADHLGIRREEFSNLRLIFSSDHSRVLLVEGQIDKEYFEYLQTHELSCDKLNQDIEIVPYGGKDTLKNTVLIQFVLRKFDRVFVTYDLDANKDCKAALNRLGFVQDKDYTPIGIDQAGKDCIEGLLPQRVISAVAGRETDLVMKLGSADRRQAKEALKKEYLKEFKKHIDYSAAELKELGKVVKKINARLGANER
jgi:hypothetical protein